MGGMVFLGLCIFLKWIVERVDTYSVGGSLVLLVEGMGWSSFSDSFLFSQECLWSEFINFSFRLSFSYPKFVYFTRKTTVLKPS